MREKIYGLLTCAMVAGLALQVSGQASRSRTTTIEMSSSSHAVRLPYTAEYKTTQVKTLADGTTITHESSEETAVDSQGRRMTSTTMIPASGDRNPITHVHVSDPVARTNSNWSLPGQRATVFHMPERGSGSTLCASTAALASPNVSLPVAGVQHERAVVEDLGTETIQGVEARGRRFTTTTPAGEIGNDAPLVRTRETWTAIAPGLTGLAVREVTEDPQAGKTTKELQNLTQEDPDPSLFQPPAGFEVVDKEASSCASLSTQSADQALPPGPE